MTSFLIAVGLVAGIWLLSLLTVIVLLNLVNKYLAVNTDPERVTETLLFKSSDY